MRTMKKMASLLRICVFLLCCSAAIASRGCDLTLAVGQSFRVPLDNKGKSFEILKWKLNGTVLIHKKHDNFYTGKADDVNTDGSLKLTNLKKNQSGLYIPEVFDKNGKSQTLKSMKLCVLDPVKKPTLNIRCLASEVVFTCSHDPRPDGTKQYDTIHYKWLQNGNMIGNATEISMTRKVAETENLLVSCEVGNDVSSATSDSLTHTCIGPVKKPEINVSCKDSEAIFTCLAAQQPDNAQYRWLRDGEVVISETKMSLTINSAESKNMNFSCEVYNQASSEKSISLSHRCVVSTFLGLPEELFGVSIWIFVGGAAGLLVLIIIIITVCCVQCKKKRGKNDEEEVEYRAGQSSSPAYCTH